MATASGCWIIFHPKCMAPRANDLTIFPMMLKFDIVLFMGVLYHLRHPLLALDLIHEHVSRDLLVFQSMQRGDPALTNLEADYSFQETAIFERPEFPRAFFIEHKYAGDPTNWWIPNRACAEAMLRSAGFRIIDNPEEEASSAGEGRIAKVSQPKEVRNDRSCNVLE